MFTQMIKATLAATLLTCGLSSHAVTLKIATLSPAGSYWMNTMQAANKKIMAETQNRVKFQFYPGGIMGSDSAVLKKIKIGQLQGAALSGGAFNNMVPGSQVYSLPRLFTSYEEVDYIRPKIDPIVREAFEKKGWVNFGLAEGGFAYLMTKQPVSDIKQLSKRKVWIPTDDPASEAAADILNVPTIPLGLGDVLAGLQTDMIDSVFASPIAAIALQWHTQVGAVTDVAIVYFYATLAVSEKAFKKISPEDQKIVRHIMGEAFKTIDAQNRKDNQAAFKALENQGIKIIKPNATEMKDWNEKPHQTALNLVKEGKVDKPLYEKVENLLTQFRKDHAKAPAKTAAQP